MHKYLRYLINSLVYFVSFWLQVLVAAYSSMSFYDDKLVGNPIIVGASIVSFFTSYKLVSFINKNIKNNNVKSFSMHKIKFKSLPFKKIIYVLISITFFIGFYFLFVEFKQNKIIEERMFRHVIEYKDDYNVSLIYYNVHDEIVRDFGGNPNKYLHAFMTECGLYENDIEKFNEIFKNDSMQLLLFEDLKNHPLLLFQVNSIQEFKQKFFDNELTAFDLDINSIIDGFAFDKFNNKMGKISASGKRIGYWKVFNNYNNLSFEGFYSQGMMNGEFKHYYYDGKLKHIGNYINGSNNKLNYYSFVPISGRDGKHIFYYKNGNIREISNFKNGSQTGFYQKWHENGIANIETISKGSRIIDYIKVWTKGGQCEVDKKINTFYNAKEFFKSW